jgi:DNA-binding SARP family transcriptional activator
MPAYTLLGPVGVVGDEGRVGPSAAKPRALLALLLLHANRSVPLDRIVDELWPDDPPETAAKAVQTYVSQLRKLAGDDRLEHAGHGYRLAVEVDEVDAHRFEALLARGRSELEESAPEAARATLAEALDLWRGRALEDVEAPFAQPAAARLEGLRLDALEGRFDAELRLSRHRAAAAELERLAEREPSRERLVELAMLALYRSGRQADALALFRRVRTRLVDELGLEPGRRLLDLERAILQGDPSLEAPEASTPRLTPEPETRPSPARPRRGIVLAAAGVAAACVVAVAAVVLLAARDGDGTGTPPPPPAAAAPLRPFVVKLEGFLVQSGEGRALVGQLVRQALECRVPADRALSRLASVERNRQSLLEQVAALSVPDDPQALDVSQRFQRAIQASMAADLRYREWLESLRGGCTPARAARLLRATGQDDAQATTAKKAFLQVYNPLARRFGRRTWSAGAF